jgi:hypothetical protein
VRENNILNKPQNIFNVDEFGIQLINKLRIVVTKKGAKDVQVLTSHERVENVRVIACCSSEGQFLPPVLILKRSY